MFGATEIVELKKKLLWILNRTYIRIDICRKCVVHRIFRVSFSIDIHWKHIMCLIYYYVFFLGSLSLKHVEKLKRMKYVRCIRIFCEFLCVCVFGMNVSIGTVGKQDWCRLRLRDFLFSSSLSDVMLTMSDDGTGYYAIFFSFYAISLSLSECKFKRMIRNRVVFTPRQRREEI